MGQTPDIDEEAIEMTAVLRDEFTGAKITVLKVKKLIEEENSIRVYFNCDDGRTGMTCYSFATVVSVDQKDICGG